MEPSDGYPADRVVMMAARSTGSTCRTPRSQRSGGRRARDRQFLHVLHQTLGDLEHLLGGIIRREPGLVGCAFGRIAADGGPLDDLQRRSIGPVCGPGPDAAQILVVLRAESVELGMLA